LRSGIVQTLNTGKEVIQENIQLSDDHGIQHLDVIVRPLVHTRDETELLMVVFREQGRIPSRRNVSRLRKTQSRRTTMASSGIWNMKSKHSRNIWSRPWKNWRCQTKI
jgi:hypothetical protein